MKTHFKTFFLFLVACFITQIAFSQTDPYKVSEVKKIKMTLSAFGVESDGFPSIDADISFQNKKANCVVSYYNPKFKGFTYTLTSNEIDTIKNLIQNIPLQYPSLDFSVNKTDQPTSTMVINTDSKEFVIKDYGLEGGYRLKEIYRIVYKFKHTIHN